MSAATQNLLIKISLQALILSWLVMLTACSSPLDYDASKLTEAQRKEVAEKLSVEQKQQLAAWFLRNTLANKDVPAGTTIAQALKEQDAWVAQEKAREAEAEALKKKQEAERQAKQAELDRVITGTVTAKVNKEGDFGRHFVLLDLVFENKSDKDIAGIKGVLRVKDMFDTTITNIKWSYEKDIGAKQTITEKGSGVEINEFRESDSKLWAADFAKLKTRFEPQVIIFKDGSKLELPSSTN